MTEHQASPLQALLAKSQSSSADFVEKDLPPLRQGLEHFFQTLPSTKGFCGVFCCDIETFQEFVACCRAARSRPPSLYAYVARCLGVTLAPQTNLLAARCGDKLLIPARVNALVLAEVSAYDGSAWPRQIGINDLGERSLDDISRELRTRLREEKRRVEPMPSTPRSRFIPAGSPLWWNRSVETLRAVRHHTNRKREARELERRRAEQAACVHLSSTSQWMQGHAGWGVQLYTPAALSVTIAGLSQRAVVVDGQIVARHCLDVAINFDHLITDGAPATRFISTLIREIESGRVLNEYSIVPRKPRQTSQQKEENAGDKTNEKPASAAAMSLTLDEVHPLARAEPMRGEPNLTMPHQDLNSPEFSSVNLL